MVAVGFECKKHSTVTGERHGLLGEKKHIFSIFIHLFLQSSQTAKMLHLSPGVFRNRSADKVLRLAKSTDNSAKSTALNGRNFYNTIN